MVYSDTRTVRLLPWPNMLYLCNVVAFDSAELYILFLKNEEQDTTTQFYPRDTERIHVCITSTMFTAATIITIITIITFPKVSQFRDVGWKWELCPLAGRLVVLLLRRLLRTIRKFFHRPVGFLFVSWAFAKTISWTALFFLESFGSLFFYYLACLRLASEKRGESTWSMHETSAFCTIGHDRNTVCCSRTGTCIAFCAATAHNNEALRAYMEGCVWLCVLIHVELRRSIMMLKLFQAQSRS